jgi:hypothetical protein
MAQVVAHLSSKCKTLSSIPTPPERKEQKLKILSIKIINNPVSKLPNEQKKHFSNGEWLKW